MDLQTVLDMELDVVVFAIHLFSVRPVGSLASYDHCVDSCPTDKRFAPVVLSPYEVLR